MFINVCEVWSNGIVNQTFHALVGPHYTYVCNPVTASWMNLRRLAAAPEVWSLQLGLGQSADCAVAPLHLLSAVMRRDVRKRAMSIFGGNRCEIIASWDTMGCIYNI